MVARCRPSGLDAAHLADEFPLLRGDRLHRQPAVFDERHILEFRLRLDGRERDWFGQRLDRGGGHRNPRLALGRRRVGVVLTDDLADGDDLLFIAGVIEKKLVAPFHLLEMPARGEIAHAAPGLALLAAFDLVVPGKLFRFGLQEPIGHVDCSLSYSRIRTTPATSSATPVRRVALTGFSGTPSSAKWSNTSPPSIWPSTISATTSAAPSRGSSK